MQSTRKKIGVDLDEVLLDMCGLAIEELNIKLGTQVKRDDLKTFHNIEDVFGLDQEETAKFIEYLYSDQGHKNVKPVQGAVSAIKNISYKNELFVITAKPDTLELKTKKWLSQHFESAFKNVHFANQYLSKKGRTFKSEICKELGIHLFIDDSLNNAHDIASIGTPVLLFDAPWNQVDELPRLVKRVFSWEEIEKEIENLLQ